MPGAADDGCGNACGIMSRAMGSWKTVLISMDAAADASALLLVKPAALSRWRYSRSDAYVAAAPCVTHLGIAGFSSNSLIALRMIARMLLMARRLCMHQSVSSAS